MKLSNPYQRSSSLANFVNGIKQLFHQKPWQFLLYSLTVRKAAANRRHPSHSFSDPIRADFSTFPTHPTNDPRAPSLDLNVQSTPDSPRTAWAIDPLGVSTAWTSPLPPATSRGAPRGSIAVAWTRPTSPLQASERRAARSPRPEPAPTLTPRPAPGGRPSAESLDERGRCSSSAVAALRPRSSPPPTLLPQLPAPSPARPAQPAGTAARSSPGASGIPPRHAWGGRKPGDAPARRPPTSAGAESWPARGPGREWGRRGRGVPWGRGARTRGAAGTAEELWHRVALPRKELFRGGVCAGSGGRSS